MKYYEVSLEYVFKGKVLVRANSKSEAHEKVVNSLSVTIGDAFASDTDIDDWKIDMYPIEKSIVKTKEL